jgi:hypothetical protein
MRVIFQVLAAFATLSLGAPMVVKAASGPDSPPSCIYRDSHYGNNAVVCIAPGYGQICDANGKWGDPTNNDKIQQLCATAQIPVPGITPVQCIYHDVKYTEGSFICVAPYYGQSCGKNGMWEKEQIAAIPRKEASGKEVFYDPCANAQVPTWNPAPASSSNGGGGTDGNTSSKK